jgi:RNA polymerase sigma factor (sigma-70 family)
VDPAILDAPAGAPGRQRVVRVTDPGDRVRASSPVPRADTPTAVTRPASLPERGASWDDRDRYAADFAALYDREHLRLVHLAFLMLGCREQAEEVVQDAFLSLHGHWAGVDNPGGYLRASVVNGCRDARRRLARYRAREPRLAAPTETWDHPDELADALATLPARQRSVLVMRYYLGLNEPEIAAALDIRPGTVKSSLHRGIRSLRHQLT